MSAPAYNRLRLFKVDDGETHGYAADSAERALSYHHAITAGEFADYGVTVEEFPPDAVIGVWFESVEEAREEAERVGGVAGTFDYEGDAYWSRFVQATAAQWALDAERHIREGVTEVINVYSSVV